MSKLDEALKRFEQVATNGFRGSDYIQVDDSRAWFREDLAVVKKSVELLGLYQEKSDLLVQIANGKYLQDDYMKLLEKIDKLEKELGEMK